ncbi:putative ribonuclease H-like domain-containing protein [Tanacetum coccineum]
MYCLVVTDDYNKFSWAFFLAKKDETSGILKDFITGIENQLNNKVKIIRCDNRTEFKNYDMNQFCGIKGIKREFSNARTQQQNGVAERKNRTLIEATRMTKPHNKTPYELLIGRTPIISFMRPFGSPVTILNTLDHLGKFDGKADEGFLVGDRTNGNARLETNSDAGQARKEKVPDQEYILLSLLHSRETTNIDSTNRLNTISSSFTIMDPRREKEQRNEYKSLFDPLMPGLEDTADLQDTDIFGSEYDDEYMGAKADLSNLETNMDVSPIPITRIHKDHPKAQIIREVDSVVQTRRMHKQNEAGLITFINKQRRTNHKDFQNCLFACFLSQLEPKKVTQDLDDEGWVEAMQEELFQFKLLNVWILVDLPHGKKAIGTKWVFRNKKDQRGIMVRNKARLVAQGYRQEEGVDYDEIFAPVARIEAIRLFLACVSFMGFTMYQMDVKSAFLYVTIEEEVYVNQPPGFVDPKFPNRVYKVEKALYGLHQAPRAWYETLSTYLLENGFRRGTIDKNLFIKKINNDIVLVQDKYVYDILKKFGFSSVKIASTLMETHNPLSKDTAGTDVDVHLYRSMIGSLMYLTSSRPDIMFAVCACLRFQVQPKTSHMHAVKRIFRYLKGQPNLGLWYPKDSPMDLIAYSDSDYASASLDRKSTTGGCQFLGCRLISWQYKKQIIVVNSTTEAEYIAACNCCGQVHWLQNQLLDYGYNFMKTKIHVDNESAICVVKNHVYHSKTKHIEIRHHFIRHSYEKKMIEMVKIHTDYNVAYLLTKAFDVTRFEFLVTSIDKKELAIPGQTTTGKELSNLLMAGSLPKTILGDLRVTLERNRSNSC